MEPGPRELLLPLVDEENACLPLPVNAVSRYWGVELPMAEAAEAARRYPAAGGSILIEGMEAAERHGLGCRVVRSSLAGLRAAIDAGVPPVVILPGIPEITQHASVITGYDPEAGTVLHYVQKGTSGGEQQEGAIPEGVFDAGWSQEGRIMMLIAPPEPLAAAGPADPAAEASNRLCLESERQRALGDAGGAQRSLREALARDPRNASAMYLLGSVLNEQGSGECVRMYEGCLAANGRSYLSHNGLGNFALKSGRFADAEGHYDLAIGIDPGRSARIYKNRAYVRGQLGRDAEAADDLREYLRLLPTAPDRGAVERAIRSI